jgi:CheY-like chemotaxis protein
MPLLLVVEDDRTQQKVIQIVAEKFGYSVVLVGTGEEA